jgi:hypothetical protein
VRYLSRVLVVFVTLIERESGFAFFYYTREFSTIFAAFIDQQG